MYLWLTPKNKEFLLIIEILAILMGPLEWKFTLITISENWNGIFLNLYRKRWPKFEHVSQIAPTPLMLQPLSFATHFRTFWYYCFLWVYKIGPPFIFPYKAEVSNCNIHRKLMVARPLISLTHRYITTNLAQAKSTNCLRIDFIGPHF
jgi:hypothetical protein